MVHLQYILAAYLIAWGVLVGYLVTLRRRRREVARALRELDEEESHAVST